MNRLIIIGNGFDLAHGIKTSYKDFMEDYLCKVINSFLHKGTYIDDLIEINFKIKGSFFHDPMSRKITSSEAVKTMFELVKSKNINCYFKSTVLLNTIEKMGQMNWVDLEMEYFNALLSANDKAESSDRLDEIKQVNNQLDFLKEKLVNYLNQQQNNFSNLFDKKPLRLFYRNYISTRNSNC